MFNSIRWKFVLIYFILVFIAMVLSGSFILNEIQNYHHENTVQKLDRMADGISTQIGKVENLVQSSEEIQGIVEAFDNKGNIGVAQEVFVIDKNVHEIIASNNEETINNKADAVVDDYNLIVSGLLGERVISQTFNQRLGRPVMEISYPIKNGASVIGVLLIREDQSEIEKTLAKSKDIILKAVALSLSVTIVLGFVITRTITEPIKAITLMAGQMAKGNFANYLEVKSDDEIGKLAGMFNYLNSRLQKSLSDISREKSKVEAIVNYMTDGVIAVDNKGTIIHINPKAFELLGISNGQDHSWKFDELISTYNENLIVKTIEDNYDEFTGTDLIHLDETIIKVNFAPFENEEEAEVAGLIFVLQDVTQNEKLDKMRQEFVANVSHELKTPLTSIKSYVETILDGLVDDRETTVHFLKVVDSEADRMARLVRDLLQLSNFDTHVMKLKMDEYDYIELVKRAIVKLEVTANKKNQKIKLITDGARLNGVFDYDRIEQVVLNILSNAIKYTVDSGMIEVFVLKIKDEVMIKIADNGIGIPEDDMGRIFERFYRVDKARSRQMGGTGLGLAIAKEIIDAHDGGIDIKSELDKGTTVSIMLPTRL